MERMKLVTSVIDKASDNVIDSREHMFVLPRSALMSYEEMRDEHAKIGISDAAAFWIDLFRNDGRRFEDFALLSTIAAVVRNDVYDPVLAATPL